MHHDEYSSQISNRYYHLVKSLTSSSMSSLSGGNGDGGGGVGWIGVGSAGDGSPRGSSTINVAPSLSSSSSHARIRPPRFRLCTHPGCSKQVQQGGVCCRHGARTSRNLCTDPSGCTNVAKRGGLCRRHGAFRLGTCGKAGCKRVSRSGGYCDSHQPLITDAMEVSSSSSSSLDNDDGDSAQALSSSQTCNMPLTTDTEVRINSDSSDDDGGIAQALSSSPSCDMQHASILLAMRAGR